MVNDVTTRRLRRLARHGDGAVLSVYLDLDPSEFATPPARETAVRSLLAQARDAVEARDGLAHAERAGLREAIDRLGERLAPDELPADGARSVAAFCAADDPEPRLLRLPAPVPSKVVLAERPHIEPLVPLARGDRWCVVLVDGREATFLAGDAAELHVTGTIEDEVHGRHDQGGWSQRRYQESISNEVARHLEHVAAMLARALDRDRWDLLVLGAPGHLRGALEHRLRQDVRERCCGWIDVDRSSATPEVVRAAAEEVVAAHRVAREREVLAALDAGVDSPAGHGAAGLPDVLEALSERRVGALLVTEGLEAPGVRCPSCGWLGATGDRCPADGTELERHEDVVDAAISAALEQSAEVVLPQTEDGEQRLGRRGGIGALLRF